MRVSAFFSAALAVLAKEIKDAWRDKRTLRMVVLLSVMQAPLVLLLVSTLVSAREQRLERRELYVQGIEHAPGLANFLARQSYTLRTPPPDALAQLASGSFDEAVLVIEADFDAKLQAQQSPMIEIIANSSSRRSSTAREQARSLVQAYVQERLSLGLALRGVGLGSLQPLVLQERDVASAGSRSAQLTGAMIPLYVLIAVLIGAMGPAMDSTAGERERGCLEPLMMNPVSPWALALGKWAAVSLVAIATGTLTLCSFIPAQWLLHSEALQALFQFGWREAMLCWCVCLPFAAAVAALMMASSVRGKTLKEAQAGNSLVQLTMMLFPLVSLLHDAAEPAWYYAVPSLAQHTLMLRVLKGQALEPQHWLLPAGICLLLTLAALAYLSRALRAKAIA